MALCHCLQHPRVLVPGFRIEVDYHAGRNLAGSLPRGLHRQSTASSRSIFLLQKDRRTPAPYGYSRGTAGHQGADGLDGQGGNNVLD